MSESRDWLQMLTKMRRDPKVAKSVKDELLELAAKKLAKERELILIDDNDENNEKRREIQAVNLRIWKTLKDYGYEPWYLDLAE